MVVDTGRGCYLVRADGGEDLSEAVIDRLRTSVQEKSGSAPILLFSSSSNCVREKRKTVLDFFLTIFRKYFLHRNERVTVLSEEDQLVALQLVLADRQKQTIGDYDVETSTVLEMNRRIMKMKTVGASDQPSDPGPEQSEYDQVLTSYQQFLSHSNYSDMVDVYLAVAKELQHNESLQKELRDQNYIVVLNSDNNLGQSKLLELLCSQSQSVYEVEMSSCLGSLEESLPNITFTQSTLPCILERNSKGDYSSQKNFTSPQKSATESYVHSAVLSYLELLVNSRSEMALARVINTPHRDLDHTAFTELKRYARLKNMPMFQTAMSFITKLRLGGKGYAPDTTCALAQHVKGLGDFSDLMQKVQTIVEEDMDTRSACRRVVNVLKNAFLHNKENRLRKSSIESAAEDIQSTICDIISVIDQSSVVTPDKPAGRGGTLVGRQTIKVIRMLLDQQATKPTSGHTPTIFGDLFSSQKTPVHFPCLLTKFRSPEEADPEEKLNLSLRDRMKAKLEKQNRAKRKTVSYKSDMDWAVPLHSLPAQDDGLCADNQVIVMPSKTLVQPGVNTIVGLSVASRVRESSKDQENISQVTRPDSETEKQVVRKSTAQVRARTDESADDGDASLPMSKKRKLQAEKPKKAVRRKLIPQIKGQQSVAKFFRV